MELRRMETHDLPAVMAILHQAQAYFKAQGIDQWQDGYPDEATLLQDIQNGTAYVAEQDKMIAARRWRLHRMKTTRRWSAANG